MGLFSLKGLGNAILDIGSSALSSHMYNQSMEKQANLQKELWTYQQSNKHQLEVEDLRAAGLNPIISAMNGQVVGQPSVSGNTNSKVDLVNAVNTAKSLQVADKQANASLITAQANEKDANTNSALAMQKIAESNETIQKIRTDALHVKEQIELTRQQAISEVLNQKLSKAETSARISAIGKQADAALISAGAQAKMAENNALLVDSSVTLNKEQIKKIDTENKLLNAELSDSRAAAERRYYSGESGYHRYGFEKFMGTLFGAASGVGTIRRAGRF